MFKFMVFSKDKNDHVELTVFADNKKEAINHVLSLSSYATIKLIKE